MNVTKDPRDMTSTERAVELAELNLRRVEIQAADALAIRHMSSDERKAVARRLGVPAKFA